MKKIIIIFSIFIVLGVSLYFLIIGDEPEVQKTTHSESSRVDETSSHSMNHKKLPKEEFEKKDTLVEDNIEEIPQKNLSLEEFNKELQEAIESNKREVEECENNIDRLIGQAIENDEKDFYEESNILNVLDDFEQTNIFPKSSSKVLELLAQNSVSEIKTEDLGKRLGDLRPCRPYKKISFIHGLMTHYGKNDWSDSTKKKARLAVHQYFEKELQGHTTISNLNMQAALLQTLVTEGMFNKKYEEEVMDFKDDLEDAYDDLLDRADEIRDQAESSGSNLERIPLEIIQKEFQISSKYRKSLQRLLGEIKTELN